MNKYLDFKTEINEQDLKQVAEEIKHGKIAVFPTETVYGIGTNGLDEIAVNKLYEVKRRPKTKAISLLVSNIEMINALTQDITEEEYKLIKAFCPGPLTIVLKKREIVPEILTAGGEYIGIRMPKGEIAKKLIEYAGIPIAAPSANISGMPSGINIQSAINDFKDTADYFIDGGEAKLKQSSTVVKVEDGIPIILREGFITKSQIEQAIK